MTTKVDERQAAKVRAALSELRDVAPELIAIPIDDHDALLAAQRRAREQAGRIERLIGYIQELEAESPHGLMELRANRNLESSDFDPVEER